MSTKRVLGIVTVVICIVIALIISSVFFHVHNISQLQVIQSFTGKTSVRTQGGL